MKRRALGYGGALAAGLAIALLPAGEASAHPLGNFTVNQYDGLVVGQGHLRVDHIEDLAEIPATQAMPRIKREGMESWAEERCQAAARGSRLRVDGRTAGLRVEEARAVTREGQAGLPTLRVECELGAPLPRGTELAARFTAAGQPGPGWREVTARGDRMTLSASDVPEASVSKRLTRYPERLLDSPPGDDSATLRITPGGPALNEERPEAPASVLPRGADRWTQALTGLVARHDLTPGFAGLALAIALLLGALHAVAPGHGKTLMAASAAARGHASLRDVLPLAASVTVTHTLGVTALGLLVAGGSAAAPSVIAWLGVVSGVLVTGAGALLLRRAWRRRGHSHHHHADHHHTHEAPPTIRGALFLGFAGGLVPSPSAVVVLVGAAALGEAWFGLLLVLAYGVGLAVTLTAAGFLVVRVGSLAGRRVHGPRWLRRTTHRFLPLGSAFVVLALGCGLVFKGAATALG
ncbi:urease accessory protein UreH domain-containing protein [Streptomyces sp. BA2]|uniref:urease accessory protein UreH domain-containing protein n=1 Tax=Streptomyces sp. BA2 TaxID=436595 RepID=UPI001325EEE5|nr:sulfite exporter TauE/SafE family protein [Streptomyces sp. BA2]MWA10102.1 nickel transporter [Streptomyces sp. BA2]